MARSARIVVPGAAHHVTQRGNDRQAVFFEEDDRLRYLAYLRESAVLYGVGITAYCLMTNHVHLVAVPETEDALSKTVGRTHLLYAQHVHHIRKRSGHFWQGRYYSCPLDELHAYNVAAYVELNPVRAGLARLAWEYPWSSAAVHCTGVNDASGLLDLNVWSENMTGAVWKETLDTILQRDGIASKIREHTRTGRPLGDSAFLKRVEDSLNGTLPALRGRPRKDGVDSDGERNYRQDRVRERTGRSFDYVGENVQPIILNRVLKDELKGVTSE